MVEQIRTDKRGFSLIELVIVMGIMAVLTGGIALGIGMTRSPHSLSFANSLNSSFAELHTQNQSFSGATYMNLYKLSDGYYVEFSADSEIKSVPASATDKGKRVGKSDCVLTIDGIDFDENYVYSFTMSKKDGSFGTTYKKSRNGTSTDVAFNASGATELDVKLTDGGAPHKVVLVSTTGRHYTE